MNSQYDGSAEWVFNHYKTQLVDTGEWDGLALFQQVMPAFVDDVAECFGIDDGSLDISVKMAKVEGYTKAKGAFEIRLPNMQSILLMENGEYIFCKSELIEDGITWNGDDEWFKSFYTKYYFIKQLEGVACELLPEIFSNPDDLVTTENMEAVAVSIINDCQDILDNWDMT